MGASSQPRQVIRQLYRDLDGFEIPGPEERAIRSSKGSPIYGEMMPAATEHLLRFLDLGAGDVFYDLGAGSGKVVLQAAMTAPLRKAVGVELSATRVGLARSALKAARRRRLLRARACAFRQEDFLHTYLADATVIYTCSTAFSFRFMAMLAERVAGLRRQLRFVTLQELEDPRGFELIEVLRLDMSWKRRSEVHVYRVG
jgi:SAM-dependent methyltransferase